MESLSRSTVSALTLAFLFSCGASHAQTSVRDSSYSSDEEGSLRRPRPPEWTEPAPWAPYRVDVTAGDGRSLRTYYQDGRTYVLGALGERYQVRVVNPTGRRVEAVVSVDGLDAVDGRTASYQKRGYLVPAYGEVTIDGFRTSMAQVAAFRFSSVRDSYAGRKGQDRNVGVIGVAFFPERYRPPPPPPWGWRYGTTYDDRGAGSGAAPPPRRGYRGESSRAQAEAPANAPAAPSAMGETAREAGRADDRATRPKAASRAARPGLGTAFGEQRDSAVQYAAFEREAPTSPAYVAEVRYDDYAGLVALGIPVDGYPSRWDEQQRRETAEPFPEGRFARP